MKYKARTHGGCEATHSLPHSPWGGHRRPAAECKNNAHPLTRADCPHLGGKKEPFLSLASPWLPLPKMHTQVGNLLMYKRVTLERRICRELRK